MAKDADTPPANDDEHPDAREIDGRLNEDEAA